MLNPNRLGLSLFVVATILLGKRFAPKFPVSLIVGPARRDLRAGSDLFVRRRLPACHVPTRASGGDLGPQSLKNIAEPVRAYLLRHGAPAAQKPPQTATATRGVWARWPALAAALALLLLAAGTFAWRAGYAPRFMAASVDDKLANAPRLSIVVLPFENLSGDKEQDYFADGITDDLTTDLSHLNGSFVIARNTAFTYKGKPVDVKQIGRELGVRYLLEGSVRRNGKRQYHRLRPHLLTTPTIRPRMRTSASGTCF